MSIHLHTIKEFADILDINSKKLVILDFYADWCGPCKILGPKLDEIAKTNSNVVVVKANAEDENLEKMVALYNVKRFPTLIFFKDNKVVDHFTGTDEKRIKSVIQSYTRL